MRGRRTILAMMAGIMLLLAGCGGGGASDSGSDGGVSLTIWADDKYSRAIKGSAAQWGEQNDVRVNIQTVSKDLQTVFVTASQAGKGPDLVMGAHDWIGNLVQNGTIDPLQITDDTRAAFNELSIEGVTFNGQVYGIPYAIENVVLFRNTDLAPEVPKSIEELVAKGKELKAAGKVSEIMALPVGPNGDAYHMYPIYTSGGGYLFGKNSEGGYDPKDLGLSKPAAAKAFEKIAGLGEKGDGALKRSISPDNVTSIFTGKKTAFLLSGPWQPLSNLDAKLRVQMRSEIAQVQHDLNVTTIYVTHDQTEAMTMGDRVAVMKAGILQALGDPQYLYDNPANIFVAGFIGSPPMNMAVGKIVREGDGLAVRLGSATIRLHPSVAKERPALAAYVARDVAVGIRSEDMEDARLVRDAPADTRLRATVSLVEALGAQVVVHFEIDAPKVVTEDTKLLEKDAHTEDVPTHAAGTKFVAAFAPRSRVRAGDEIEVVVDTERMHFFDTGTGLAIRA